ncbi:hypothetical protein [Actinomadura pelletieri]|uniref:hypothetical protein n=1 Tax=Actinomadura pelletieri TaxID=111805 RepID=UPI0011C3FF0C|nr:hypothetical protein [Actinomadura pelletieri]
MTVSVDSDDHNGGGTFQGVMVIKMMTAWPQWMWSERDEGREIEEENEWTAVDLDFAYRDGPP